MAKAKKKTILVEKCSSCQSEKFSISSDMHKIRHCTECRHIWSPMSKDQLEKEIYKNQYAEALGFAKHVNAMMLEIELLEVEMSVSQITGLVKNLKKESEIICGQSVNM